MKMGAGLFWGIILIILGLGIVLKVVLKIDIPIFKILIAFFFIYLGIKILIGSGSSLHFRGGKNDAVFSESHVNGSKIESKNYNAVFGKINLDFRNIVLEEKITTIEINVVFGGAEIRIDNDLPVRVKASSAFGGVKLPDGSSGGFGTSVYESDSVKNADKILVLDVNAVFGGAEVISY